MTEASPSRAGVTVAPTADVDDRAAIGPGTRIWHLAQIREDAALGRDCNVGRGAYVGAGAHLSLLAGGSAVGVDAAAAGRVDVREGVHRSLLSVFRAGSALRVDARAVAGAEGGFRAHRLLRGGVSRWGQCSRRRPHGRS